MGEYSRIYIVDVRETSPWEVSRSLLHYAEDEIDLRSPKLAQIRQELQELKAAKTWEDLSLFIGDEGSLVKLPFVEGEIVLFRSSEAASEATEREELFRMFLRDRMSDKVKEVTRVRY